MKTLEWVGSSKKDLLAFPDDVKKEVGYALYLAQNGGKYQNAKPFKGHGTGVYEIVIDFNKNAYRSVYVAHFAEKIYVLHCFQKKSKTGIETPKKDVDVIESRISFVSQRIKK